MEELDARRCSEQHERARLKVARETGQRNGFGLVEGTFQVVVLAIAFHTVTLISRKGRKSDQNPYGKQREVKRLGEGDGDLV